MFERLQTKWKVSGTQLFLVLSVFAIAGSATGWIGKIIMNWLSIEQAGLWTLVYIIVVTLLWPINVLVVSIPFGQFSFFRRYLSRMAVRMKLAKDRSIPGSQIGSSTAAPVINKIPSIPVNIPSIPVNIAVFASGTGTNAKRIIEYFHYQKPGAANVRLIVCNNPGALVLQVAKEAGVQTLRIEKERFFRGDGYLPELKNAGVDFIVLAGFLWKIPQSLIYAYRNNIINIHPALLPKFGGKGMYGSRVHESVISAGEKESGITIHYVDEHYDNGDIIFQAKVEVTANDSAESLAKKIHSMEYDHYPSVIEQLLFSQMSVKKH